MNFIKKTIFVSGQIVNLYYYGSGLTFVHSNNSHFLTGAGLYIEDTEIENRTVVHFTDIKYYTDWIRNIYIKNLDHVRISGSSYLYILAILLLYLFLVLIRK